MSELPAGDVLVRVHYSSLNYKDALSATGNKGVTRKYPHTPGVDAAGIVEESAVSDFKHGDEVIVTGNDLGTNTDGGFAEYIRIPPTWIVQRPPTLSLRESMMLGTAGYTAALSVHKLMYHGVAQERGPVLVTGATGGVGCVAVALLSKLGFHVIGVTGKTEAKQFLLDLGAKEILTRDEIRDTSGKGLLPGRWAGVVDTVGGELLDSAIRYTKLEGAVASCGNITSGELTTSIYPFILRGVSLLGINSAFTPMNVRQIIWKKLATEWKLENLDRLITEVTLEQLGEYIDLILRGGVKGRVLVKIK
ncbi:MAG: quinone oxidoreductase [Bacteroidetes bacterium]|nr:quinone oxidoreductase [Bacteroidota bacterium]